MRRHRRPLLDVTLIQESGRIESIRTADDYPFYVVTPGPPPAWTEARLLRGTDLLATMSGPATVESVRFSGVRATVYNLSVAGTSNYYIGHDAVLVHNCRVPKPDIREFAKIWLLDGPKVHPKLGRRSHGQEWFEDTFSKNWFTFDVDSHSGGVWKVFDKHGKRVRTIDINGQVVGD